MRSRLVARVRALSSSTDSSSAAAAAAHAVREGPRKANYVLGIAAGLTFGLATLSYLRFSEAKKRSKLDELHMAWADEARDGVMDEERFLTSILTHSLVAEQALEESWLRSIFRPAGRDKVTLQFADYAFLEALAHVEPERLLLALSIFANDKDRVTLLELRKALRGALRMDFRSVCVVLCFVCLFV